ncbi:MAG: phytanoyl-CoA dioxygenase family protein [Pseudomonadota bacterium]
MDFAKMLEDWRRIVARSVLVCHHVCAVVGVLLLLSITAFPYLDNAAPDAAMLSTALVTGILCLIGSCAFGGGIRYAVYGDFKLFPGRSFRAYFSGDDDGEEGKAYIPAALPPREQRCDDDELVDRVATMVSTGDLAGFREAFNELQSKPAVAPGEISAELAPRVRELGLERNCRELWEQGYTVLEDAASADDWQALRSAILKAGYPAAGGASLLQKYPVVAQAAINPKMMALAEFSVGAGFILSNIASTIRRRGDEQIGLHCDQVWHPVPFPEHNLFLTACWACDDFTLESGATTIAPGSAAKRRPPNLNDIAAAPTIPIECKAGSIAVWDGRIWHDNANRTIDGERAVLHVSYTRLMLRQMEVYPLPLQDRLIEAYGEAMAQLLGRYDFLAKPEGKAYLDGFMRAVAYSRR